MGSMEILQVGWVPIHVTHCIQDLAEGMVTKSVRNPAFVATAEGCHAQSEEFVRERIPMGDGDAYARKGELRDLCSAIAKQIKA